MGKPSQLRVAVIIDADCDVPSGTDRAVAGGFAGSDDFAEFDVSHLLPPCYLRAATVAVGNFLANSPDGRLLSHQLTAGRARLLTSGYGGAIHGLLPDEEFTKELTWTRNDPLHHSSALAGVTGGRAVTCSAAVYPTAPPDTARMAEYQRLFDWVLTGPHAVDAGGVPRAVARRTATPTVMRMIGKSAEHFVPVVTAAGNAAATAAAGADAGVDSLLRRLIRAGRNQACVFLLVDGSRLDTAAVAAIGRLLWRLASRALYRGWEIVFVQDFAASAMPNAVGPPPTGARSERQSAPLPLLRRRFLDIEPMVYPTTPADKLRVAAAIDGLRPTAHPTRERIRDCLAALHIAGPRPEIPVWPGMPVMPDGRMVIASMLGHAVIPDEGYELVFDAGELIGFLVDGRNRTEGFSLSARIESASWLGNAHVDAASSFEGEEVRGYRQTLSIRDPSARMPGVIIIDYLLIEGRSCPILDIQIDYPWFEKADERVTFEPLSFRFDIPLDSGCVVEAIRSSGRVHSLVLRDEPVEARRTTLAGSLFGSAFRILTDDGGLAFGFVDKGGQVDHLVPLRFEHSSTGTACYFDIAGRYSGVPAAALNGLRERFSVCIAPIGVSSEPVEPIADWVGRFLGPTGIWVRE